MTPSSIKAQIAIRELKSKDIAKQIGCTEVELSYMISGQREYAEYREPFANIFGMTASEMFNEEFEAVTEYLKRKSA